MATWYFDSILGNDSTGNGSQELPWAQYDNKYASVANGDTCLFKRGTTQTIATLYRQARSGVSAAQPFVMAAYGTGANPRFIYPTAAWAYVFNFGNCKWVICEDLDFDAQGLAHSCVYIAGQGTGECSGLRFRRCRFYNGGPQNSGAKVIKEAASTTATVTDIIFTNCDFFDNGEHGIIVTGATAVTLRRCRVWGNGATATAGGHGISFSWLRTEVTSGWTLVSGTTYKRTLTASEAAGSVKYMKSTPYAKVIKNTGTPTTPNVGEFGVSAGELYVNINANPSGIAIQYAWGRCGDNLVEDCIAFGNLANPSITYQEGHGLAFDDYTEDSTFRRCKSYSNEGHGISLNRGSNNLVENCLIYNNGGCGIGSNTSDGSKIYGCTIANNSRGNSFYTAGALSHVLFSSLSANVDIKNSAILSGKNPSTYGIDISPGTTGCVVDHCEVTGFSTSVRTVTPTNEVTADPLLTSDYRPTPSSPLIGAGTHLGYTRDVEGKQRPNPPSIGAYDVAAFTQV